MTHPSYTLDSRVEALLAEIATALLDGLLTRAEPMDFARALAQLEVLQVAAWYVEAGVPHDDESFCDPAGRAVVTAMWQALAAGLADDELDRISRRWRCGPDQR